MISVSKYFLVKLNITSHSFQILYISKLRKNTKNIKFVSQTIRHPNFDSISSYASQMTNMGRESLICGIKNVIN